MISSIPKNLQIRGAGKAGEEAYNEYDDEHAGAQQRSR